MAFVGNMDFSSALSKPAAVSALLLSTLKRVLSEEGASELTEDVVSISEKDNVVSIRTGGPLVASALKLRSGKIETAFTEALARFGRKGTLTVRIR